MPTTRRGLLFAGLIAAVLGGLLLLPISNAVHSQTNTATPTSLTLPTLAVAASATPTRPRLALASPTPTPTANIPEPLLTLTAFSSSIIATFENRPTVTPGPSAIILDGKPHYIRFTATWCQPCRVMRPDVQAMKDKYSDQVTFWDIDIDNPASRRLIQRYGVQFIPYTVLLDSQGRTFEVLEGLQSRSELDTAIRALLANE